MSNILLQRFVIENLPIYKDLNDLKKWYTQLFSSYIFLNII